MGFKYHKRDTKKTLYEQAHIIAQRHNFLRKIRSYRQEKRPIVYLDETWLNAHHTLEKSWIDYDGRGGLRVYQVGKGVERLFSMLDLNMGGYQIVSWFLGGNLEQLEDYTITK